MRDTLQKCAQAKFGLFCWHACDKQRVGQIFGARRVIMYPSGMHAGGLLEHVNTDKMSKF